MLQPAPPFQRQAYDYIFIGAGCAGLSLLVRMLQSGQFSDKHILLIDKAPKTANDRTWCFWETNPGYFDHLVHHRWNRLAFLSDEHTAHMTVSPYQYKMIRGADFYQYCFGEIARHANTEIVYTTITGWRQEKGMVYLSADDREYALGPATVFNSIYEPASGSLRLLQHFKGRVIETDTPCFHPGEATMMDFRVHQEHGTTFAYVLPFSETKALVEYTLFTRELLAPEQYDAELDDYIRRWLGISSYRIAEEEFGVIPMTNERLRFKGQGWQIGTAGGQTKASSGYTFRFIQKQSDAILQLLLAGQPLERLKDTPRRFRFYDHTLLYILYHDKVPGKTVFSRLFKKNTPQQVLRFLDNESSLAEELKIIRSLPVWPFFKAAMKVT